MHVAVRLTEIFYRDRLENSALEPSYKREI